MGGCGEGVMGRGRYNELTNENRQQTGKIKTPLGPSLGLSVDTDDRCTIL